MTSIYELRNEVAINCKRVRRSPVRERSLIIELKRLLVEVPELADAFGTAAASEALTIREIRIGRGDAFCLHR